MYSFFKNMQVNSDQMIQGKNQNVDDCGASNDKYPTFVIYTYFIYINLS